MDDKELDKKIKDKMHPNRKFYTLIFCLVGLWFILKFVLWYFYSPYNDINVKNIQEEKIVFVSGEHSINKMGINVDINIDGYDIVEETENYILYKFDDKQVSFKKSSSLIDVDEESKKVLDSINVKTELDLIKYAYKKESIKNILFTNNEKMLENYILQSNMKEYKDALIVILSGSIDGMYIQKDNSHTITAFNKDYRYDFKFIGEYSDSEIKHIVSTIKVGDESVEG